MNVPATLGGTGGKAAPTPRRRPLKTLDDVRVQMAGLYWQAKAGKLPTQEATRLVWILVQVGNVIQSGELEQRVAALESSMEVHR